MGFALSCAELLGDFVIPPDRETRIDDLLTDGGDAGEVQPRVCEEGQIQCDGALLQSCVDEGRAWLTLQPCATAALCEPGSGGGPSGCLTPTCAEDEMSCDGAELRLCNADRNGWEPFDSCETPAHCDAGARQCLPVPCLPGDRRCNTGNLERCRDDQLDWELLDTCWNNPVCESTLINARENLLDDEAPVESDGTDPDYQAPTILDVDECLPPTCTEGEIRCVGDRVEACDQFQTGWRLAEVCATTTLCQASLTYVGLGGRPRCQKPACGDAEHRCSENGVLERCRPGREAFDPIEECVGPPFCNAVEANAGRAGCQDAPCQVGELRCNGNQPQRCLPDRTGFENAAPACETSGLCNPNNPGNNFCNRPACRRGAQSPDEFLCQGASLLRCNDQHTGYEPFQQCVTPGLCNAGFGFEGCRPEACAPGQFLCQGDTLSVCNDQQTGFRPVEQCGAGECNAAAGSCADPCIEGTARCNGDGTLEECRNRLVGREVTARCASQQLCDVNARTCRQPVCQRDGDRRCRQQGQNTVLEVCVDGRSRFATLDTCGPSEFCDTGNDRCDVCDQNSQPTCEGNSLVTCAANGQSESSVNCSQGCQSVVAAPDRCRNCVPGSSSCDGQQLVVCEQQGNNEVFDREDCDSGALCRLTLGDCASGALCSCRGRVCDEFDFQCNGRQPQQCRDDFTGFENRGNPCRDATFCVPSNGTCLVCGPGDLQCDGTDLQGCRTDRLGFEDLDGDVQCVSDSGPSISCDGVGTAVDRQNCSTGICVPGIGCAECRSRQGEEILTCVDDTTQSRCLSGQLTFSDCRTTAVCREPICTGAGNCTTTPAPARAVCDLDGAGPGVGGGLCDGSAASRCLECLRAGDCDDGNSCTVDSCNDLGACVHEPQDSLCDDGRFCNGVETCSAANGCQPGQAPNCNDGDACTNDSCSNQQASCINADVVCDDGFSCSGGNCVCSEDFACDDGLFCNGGETCGDDGQCDPGTGPCGGATPVCLENGDRCVECNGNGDCANRGVRNLCRNNQCVQCGPQDPCADANVCDGRLSCSADGLCVNGDPPNCPPDDGLVCNGEEICDPAQSCRTIPFPGCPPAPVCQVAQCSNQAGGCETVNATSGTTCNGGFCDGAGNCRECLVADTCPTRGHPDCAARTCVANACGVAATNDGGNCATGVCEGINCVAQCNGATCEGDSLRACTNGRPGGLTGCPFGCTGTACDQCSADNCPDTNPDPCIGRRCNGARNGCEDDRLTGPACGVAGTCQQGQCVEPPPPPVCGDGNIEPGEVCDSNNFGNATCPDGSTNGLVCVNCSSVDRTGCPQPVVCGDGNVEAGEVCDSNDFDGATCPDGTTDGLVCVNCATVDATGCAAQ